MSILGLTSPKISARIAPHPLNLSHAHHSSKTSFIPAPRAGRVVAGRCSAAFRQRRPAQAGRVACQNSRRSLRPGLRPAVAELPGLLPDRHFLKTCRCWRFKKLAVSNNRIAPSETDYDRHQG